MTPTVTRAFVFSVALALGGVRDRRQSRRPRAPTTAASSRPSSMSSRRARAAASGWSRAVSSAACIGHQIGSGRGNTVATIAGAAGGAYVGNEVEKKKNTTGYWAVTIKMDAGNVRTFTYSNQPTVHENDRVKLVDGGKRLALLAN